MHNVGHGARSGSRQKETVGMDGAGQRQGTGANHPAYAGLHAHGDPHSSVPIGPAERSGTAAATEFIAPSRMRPRS